MVVRFFGQMTLRMQLRSLYNYVKSMKLNLIKPESYDILSKENLYNNLIKSKSLNKIFFINITEAFKILFHMYSEGISWDDKMYADEVFRINVKRLLNNIPWYYRLFNPIRKLLLNRLFLKVSELGDKIFVFGKKGINNCPK